ncbi:hypothetical protein GQ457_04G023000 [Hibiscus cannabinus]
MFSCCPYCKKTNHPQKRCWWRSDVKCNRCGQLGHVEKICKSSQQQGEANAAQNPQDDEQMFVASCFTTSSSNESWLIDSGCTNHMSYDRGIFKELQQTVVSRVKKGNGAYINVEGKGTVAIEDAKNKYVFNIHMKEKSFALDFMQEEQADVHKEESHTMLWHRRLGHFHHAAIFFMKKNNLAKGLPQLEKELHACEICRYGKQTRLPFPQKTAWRAVKKLQLVHT